MQAKGSQVGFSLEIFPAKSPETVALLWKNLKLLAPLGPDYISVTCNVHPDNIHFTRDLVIKIQHELQVKAAAHVTLTHQTQATLEMLAEDYWRSGINHIVALRGDFPPGYKPVKGLEHAIDVVRIFKSTAAFEISVAGYPQKHPEASSLEKDIDYLKQKVDAGANRVISQFFFDPAVFLRFRDLAVKKGVKVEIVPGILPILNFTKLQTFAERCQAEIPPFLHQLYQGLTPDSLDHQLLSMNVISHQVTKLMDEGVEFFHFYTLNESVLIRQVCRWLKLGF